MKYLVALFISLTYFNIVQASQDWSVNTVPGIGIQFVAHGDTVHGHEFGFIKKPGQCDQDVLWFTWSTEKATANELQGKSAIAHIQVSNSKPNNNFELPIDMPLHGAIDGEIKGLTLISLTNVVATPTMIDALAKGKTVRITLTGADDVFDVREDEFTLRGYTASRREAQKLCDAL